MTVVIHLRGTSGSGKSTLIKRFLDDPALLFANEEGTPLDPNAGSKMTLLGYVSMAHPLAVVGPYKTPCGGCDAVKTQEEICLRVKRFAVTLQKHTLFEGLLASGLFSRYRDLAQQLEQSGVQYTSCIMPAPLDLCLERLQARRAARGDDRPLDPKNTVAKHGAILTAHHKLLEAGVRSIVLPAGREYEYVRDMLGLPPVGVA